MRRGKGRNVRKNHYKERAGGCDCRVEEATPTKLMKKWPAQTSKSWSGGGGTLMHSRSGGGTGKEEVNAKCNYKMLKAGRGNPIADGTREERQESKPGNNERKVGIH